MAVLVIVPPISGHPANASNPQPLTPLPALTSIAETPTEAALSVPATSNFRKIVFPTDFYLHDGDRVVFFGDSITQQRMYTTDIETYCVTRFPSQHFEFINAGWPWDKVTGGPGGSIDTRLARDVFARKPSVITICLGSNDAGLKPFNRGDFEAFAVGYRHIMEQIRKNAPLARVTLISPPTYDDYSREPRFPGGTNQILYRYSAVVKALAYEYNATFVDCNASLAWFVQAAVKLSPSIAQSILPDRIHPGEAGNLVIATTILRAWSGPAVANVVDIDAAAVTATGTGDVTNLQTSAIGVTFTMTSSAIPWPFERDFVKNPDVAFFLATTNIQRDFNKCRLTVTGLPKAGYHLFIDGSDVGVFSRDQFEGGIPLADIPGPESSQAFDVLTAARDLGDAEFHLWRLQIGKPVENPSPADTDIVALATRIKADTAAEQTASQPAEHHYELIAEDEARPATSLP